MNIVEQKLYNMNPGFLRQFGPLVKKYSQFGGGAADDGYLKGRYFSNAYELYMFSFFIGLKKDESYEIAHDDKLDTFWEIKNWKPEDMRDHLITCSIAKTDIDLMTLQTIEDSAVEAEIKKVRRTIEKYANGGLQFISTKVDEDPDQAEQDDFFISMLS